MTVGVLERSHIGFLPQPTLLILISFLAEDSNSKFFLPVVIAGAEPMTSRL